MTGLPSVSVLIPCRNAGTHLDVAVASALQCTGVIEVIVADDGSTDDSGERAERFGAPVRVLRLAQGGGNAARNAAAAAARGEWLQFLDADDYLEPHKLVRQFAEAGPLDGLDVLYSPVWIETVVAGAVTARQASPVDTKADLFTQWINWQLPQTGGPLWRASALQRVGGWNPAMPCCQEHELYLRALQGGLHWKYCPTPGAVYRIWSEQTVCRRDPVQVIRQRTALIERLLCWLRDEDRLRPDHEDAAGQAFFEMARTWARDDLAGATVYVDERHRNRLRLRGPAAPFSYRAAHWLLGFRRAEQIARRLR